eukprot:363308-Chlamydomonas_euryale.AAC.13
MTSLPCMCGCRATSVGPHVAAAPPCRPPPPQRPTSNMPAFMLGAPDPETSTNAVTSGAQKAKGAPHLHVCVGDPKLDASDRRAVEHIVDGVGAAAANPKHLHVRMPEGQMWQG